jgi:hypothetical protein
MEKIRKKIKSFVKPMSAGWKGASIGLAAVTVCLCIVQAYYMLGSHGAVDMMVGAVLYIAAGVLICGIVALAAHFLKKVPSRYMGLCAGSALCLLFCFIVPPQVAGMVPVTRIDLTVKVADKKGNEASLPLSSVAPLLPMIEGEIIKAPISSAIPTKEPVFQSYGFA